MQSDFRHSTSPDMRFGINLPWSDVGTASALMTGRVTSDYVVREYRTPLSIKAIRRLRAGLFSMAPLIPSSMNIS